jgi:hypothetical protein
MPGSYAHITMVNQAAEKRRLLEITGFPREDIDAAGLQAKFLELGCVSPDYPYLDITSGDSKKWADAKREIGDRFLSPICWLTF